MSFQIDDLTEASNIHPLQSFLSSQQTTSDDLDIENLQNQIDGMSAFLHAVQSDSDNRKQRYANELEKLKLKIDEEQKKSKDRLERQNEAQKAEINQLIEDQENEINEVLLGTNVIEYDRIQWNGVSADLKQLSSMIEHTELQKSINQMQGETDEIEFSRSRQNEEQKTRSMLTRELEQNKLQSLQNEINQYRSLIREENKYFSDFMRDYNLSQTSRLSQQQFLTNKLKYEIQQRENIFNEHLNLIQNHVKKEKQRVDTDLLAFKEAEESLIQLKRRTSQKCIQQLSETTNDINKVQQTLEKLTDSNDSNNDSTSVSFSKTQNLQKENLQLKIKIDKVVAEIEKIKNNIQIGKSELNRIRNPHQNSFQGYSRRSLFF